MHSFFDSLKTKLFCKDKWMTNNKSMHDEEQQKGNYGLLWEHLGRFPNKKITSLSDLEERREKTNGFKRFMMNYSHMLTEKLFFEII